MGDLESFSGSGDRRPTPSRRTQGLDARVARLATEQFGLITLAQLSALGLTYDAVRARVRRGLLHPIHRGVYAVGHRSLVHHARLLAAQLTSGPESFLSHRTSAAVFGLRAVALARIEVTVACTSALSRPGLVMHRTRAPVDGRDVVVRNGLRISSLPRMLIELSSRERPEELGRLVTESVRKGLFDSAAIEEALIRHGRRPGLARLKHVLRHYRPRPDRKSQLEVAFDKLIAGTDIPEPERNVMLFGWEIDCWWPLQRLVVELDGRPYHVAVMDIERDKLKDAKLLRRGIRTLRVTDWRMEADSVGILDDVRAILRLS